MGRQTEEVIRKYEKYVHHGDMRYLRRTPKNKFNDLRVYSNPSVIHRAIWYFQALLLDWRSPTKNHDIDLYAAKLAAYANDRLKKPKNK